MQIIKASIGEGFEVFIHFADDGEDVTDVKVFSAKTGEEVTDLIYGTTVWNEAWGYAERRVIYGTSSQAEAMRQVRETCYDTPYATI